MGEKGLPDGQQVYMPDIAKIWQKAATKCTKLAVNHQNGTNSGQRECFCDVLAQVRHFEGLELYSALQAAASTKFSPKRPRLPEKPLKTLLNHQNDHRGQKKGKVAFLDFSFEHFKG